MTILEQTESINLADKGALWLPLSIELAKKFILNELLDQHS